MKKYIKVKHLKLYKDGFLIVILYDIIYSLDKDGDITIYDKNNYYVGIISKSIYDEIKEG